MEIINTLNVGFEYCSDANPDPWIRICTIKFGSGSVWRVTNPDPDPGHILSGKGAETCHAKKN